MPTAGVRVGKKSWHVWGGNIIQNLSWYGQSRTVSADPTLNTSLDQYHPALTHYLADAECVLCGAFLGDFKIINKEFPR